MTFWAWIAIFGSIVITGSCITIWVIDAAESGSSWPWEWPRSWRK